MRTTFIALFGCLAVAGSGDAAPPAAPAPAAEAPAVPVPPEPDSGKVLILDNEQLLDGEVTRVGDQYRVKRTLGETYIPARQVLRLAEDRKQAYEIVRRRANPRDADERMRLARWCMLYGLRDEALAEAHAAARLRPNDPETQMMVRGLTHLKASAATPPEPTPQPVDLAKVEEVPPPADFNSNAYGMFVAKVQPLLMNSCASCHAGGKGGSFKLVRVFDGSNNRRGTLFNLSATLARLNREHPAGSPLLAKALVAHGDAAKPPLKGAETPAYRLLESWVQFALSPEGTPRPETASLRSDPAAGAPDVPDGVPVSREQPKPLPKPPRLPGPRKEPMDNQPKGKFIGYQQGIRVAKPDADADPDPAPAGGKEKEPKAKRGSQPPAPKVPFAEGSKSKPVPEPPADEFDPAIFNNLGKEAAPKK